MRVFSVEELSQLQRSVANSVVEQKGDRVTQDLPKQSASQVPEIPGPHPLYGVPSGELAEDGVDPVAQAAQEGAPLGRGTALLVPVGREEFDANAPRQPFLRLGRVVVTVPDEKPWRIRRSLSRSSTKQKMAMMKVLRSMREDLLFVLDGLECQ